MLNIPYRIIMVIKQFLPDAKICCSMLFPLSFSVSFDNNLSAAFLSVSVSNVIFTGFGFNELQSWFWSFGLGIFLVLLSC